MLLCRLNSTAQCHCRTMQENAKRIAARKALEFASNASIVGLGTGSTTKFAIEGLAELIHHGASFRGVATSKRTEKLARELGIPLVELAEAGSVDVTIDGADEIDPAFNMIKGGGGALTREKLVALASSTRVIIADETKLVSVLGTARPLPVEVLPFAWTMSARLVAQLNCTVTRREENERPFITDNGNFVLDCKFDSIPDPAAMETRIKLVPGVVECGLFIGIADIVVIGSDSGARVLRRP